MAQNKEQVPVKEVIAKTEQQEKLNAVFASVKEALQLVDLTKTETRTFNTFSKDKLRNYMKNPKSNETNLRNLSQFLYRMSHQYRRIIGYLAGMIDLSAYTVVPKISMTEDNDVDTVLSNYEQTLTQIRKMNMKSQIYKCLLIAWREDTFYGYVYEDDEAFFIMPLDGNYCKVSSANYDGTLNFAFDFSYLKANETLLDYWDSEFKSKYNKYQNDNKLRWQELDPDRTICLKVNCDDATMAVPPFAGIFEQLIDLIDLQSIQSVKEELSIYKLLVARIQTLSGAKTADEFTVDLDTAIAFYNKISDALPENVSSVLSPLQIDPIEFKGTTTDDVDMIANSMSNLFQSAGVAQILDNTKLSGSTAFTASIICDSLQAIQDILPQIESWVNRYIAYTIGDVQCEVSYIPITPYTKSAKVDELLKAAQYGVPVKLQLASLLNLDPMQSYSMNFLENQCLELHKNWIPLQSSYTQSGNTDVTNEGGRPQSDTLTPEGEATKDQNKNDNE